MTYEFKPWAKIPRGGDETIIVSEKINGTNSCVIIQDNKVQGAQSRNRLITPDDDNFNFAKWVASNEKELEKLGDGYHYGEWAGEGIQKNPHNIEGRKFFLFNTSRWHEDDPLLSGCCDVVPVLYAGVNYPSVAYDVLAELRYSAQQKGYKPEGIIIWYNRGRRFEKYTLDNPEGKWQYGK